MNDIRPYFNEPTARLAERIEETKQWFQTLHTIYVEWSHREKAAAQTLRAELARLFAATKGHFPWPTTDVGDRSGTRDPSVFQFERGVPG